MSFDPGLPDESVNVGRGSALGEAGRLLGGLVAASAAAVAVIAFSVESLVLCLPAHLEARWLAAFGESLAEEGPADPRAARVEALVDRLARHWPDAPYRFRSAVLDEPRPNAFALPGGWILVTSGLLDEVRTENELAFVLGHELGHFRNRDHLRGLGRGVAWALVSSAVGLGEGTAGAVARLAGSLSQRHFDRDQESDADRFGLELLALEYGHTAGAAAVFERILVSGPEDGGDPGNGEEGRRRLSDYLSTHPASQARIRALSETARARGWAQRGASVPWDPGAAGGAQPPPTGPE